MPPIPQYIGPINIVPLIPYIAIAAIIGFILTIVPGLIWFERVWIALMQDRIGPNRVGPRGLLQTIADGVKLFFKEDIEPANVDKRIYYMAPVLTMIPALAAGATLPFAAISVRMAETGEVVRYPVVGGDVNIGVLFILALASLQVYGIVLGGWSSNNKYSLLGGLRSSAQIISYELAMSLALMTGILMSGSLMLTTIVERQQGGFWQWNIFQYYGLGLIAATIYIVSMIAETNRAPFDLPEAESELIAGFHTEYSSMKFAMFFMGEYASMLVVSGVATALWLGGWNSPFPVVPFTWVPSAVWFLLKMLFFFFIYVWLRGSLPRLRYDALMNLGWKRFLPTALAVLFGVALVDTFFMTPREVPESALRPGAEVPASLGAGAPSGVGAGAPVRRLPMLSQPGGAPPGPGGESTPGSGETPAPGSGASENGTEPPSTGPSGPATGAGPDAPTSSNETPAPGGAPAPGVGIEPGAGGAGMSGSTGAAPTPP